MAPRLTRWALIGVAGSLLVIWLLLPSGRSIFFGWWGGEPLAETSLQVRRWAVSEARRSTEAEIERRRQMAAFEEVVRSAMARREDPVVFAPDSTAMRGRAGLAAHVAKRWGELSTRDPGLLSVYVIRSDWGWLVDPSRVGHADSLCVMDSHDQQFNGVDWSIGKCALRERFGPPGEAWRGWLEATPELPFDLKRGPYTRHASAEERPRPWFAEDDWQGWAYWGLWSERVRILVSCAGGTQGSCRGAFGLGVGDSSALDMGSVRMSWRGGKLDSRSTLPGGIYRELGEEGFARLWRSDTTIAAGYEMISGRPIDPLLHQLAFAMVGTRPKDNGLSPIALVGALIWIGLFGALAALRLQERRIG